MGEWWGNSPVDERFVAPEFVLEPQKKTSNIQKPSELPYHQTSGESGISLRVKVESTPLQRAALGKEEMG